MLTESIEVAETEAFMEIREVHGIYVDAVLTDEADNLIFISLWGRDTSIRELQARITLGDTDSGLTGLNIYRSGTGVKKYVDLFNAASLEQITGRISDSIFGDLVHCFLYQKAVVYPDLANHRSILIHQDGVSEADHISTMWNIIKAICPVPLLDHWCDVLLPIMKESGMISSLSGINQCGTKIAIDEEQMAAIVKQQCVEQRLAI